MIHWVWWQEANDWVWWQKALEALFTTIGGLATLGVGWFVGLRLTSNWNLRQKRRELELTTLDEFYKLYGEFFAVLKLWKYYKDGMGSPDDTHWDLLERAAHIDGRIEAMLMKVSSERQLGKEELDCLGLLRQGFQRLRESIADDQRLDWNHSDHEEYATLKKLSSAFSTMLVSEKDYNYTSPETDKAKESFIRITANSNEAAWKEKIKKEKLGTNVPSAAAANETPAIQTQSQGL